MTTKYLKILAILFVTVFSFSACSDDDDEEEEDKKDTATELTVTGANCELTFDSFSYYMSSYETAHFRAEGTTPEGAKISLSWTNDADDADITPSSIGVSIQRESGGYVYYYIYYVDSGSITLINKLKDGNNVTVRFNRLWLRDSYEDPYNDDGIGDVVTLHGSVVFEYDDWTM